VPLPEVSAPASGQLTLSRPISLVLIDDNRSSREGVVALIRKQPGFHVLATSADVEAAVRTVRETKPDIVLLDLGQEDDDRLVLAGALHGAVPESQVIIMGLVPLQTNLASFVRAGVSGFIMKDASFDRFLSTIRSVAQNIRVLPTELTGSLFGQLGGDGVRGRKTETLEGGRLASRERAVTDLIVQGSSDKEIAGRLQIALHTAKSHVHKVLSKLAVNKRLDVAALSQNGAPPAGAPPAAASRDRSSGPAQRHW
jgi:DNA-binding NarL/FixJ family response regulator